ncbi:MAG: hypothetical protein MZV49_08300 [Rhodopseudomonas palustris]|nr:hypothetical protein [Rhodopseudomonas palustris]
MSIEFKRGSLAAMVRFAVGHSGFPGAEKPHSHRKWVRGEGFRSAFLTLCRGAAGRFAVADRGDCRLQELLRRIASGNETVNGSVGRCAVKV